MGGILSKPKAPTPAQIAPETTEAQRRAEERAAEEERRAQAQLSSRRRAMRYGGTRSLLSQERENAELGVTPTLGPG